MTRTTRIGMSVLAAGLALAGPMGPRAISFAAAAGPLPTPEVSKLETGLRVAVFPDHRLPIIQIQLLIPAGITAEPVAKSGVAYLTGQSLRAGSASRSAEVFGADLERLGGSFNVTVGRDYVTVSGAFLARDLDAGLELVADAATHPVFPPLEVDQIKREAAGGLLQGLLNPGTSADERLWSLVFGSHPYGRPLIGTVESLPRITADDLRAFHRESYRPDRAVLAIAGDVTPARALAAAGEWFGAWSGRATGSAIAAPAPAPKDARIILVDRPEVERAEIRLGAPTAPRDAPDYLALALANHCLGGAPWSRLAQAVASPGSAEGVRSSITPLLHTGLFALAASVAPESAAAVVARLRDQVVRFLASPPTEDELGRAKGTFQNVFPLQFETLAGRTSQWLAADRYGLPADFFDRYDARIQAVSAAEAAAAARRWIDPTRLDVVVVGPAARVKPLLEPLGPVEVLAPPPSLAEQSGAGDGVESTPEQQRRGRELFDLALAAHGGAGRLKGLKDSSIEGDLILYQGGNQLKGVLRQVRKEPYKMLFTTHFKGFETRQTLDGRAGWSFTGVDTSQIAEADSARVAGLRAAYDSDPAHLLLAVFRPGVVLSYAGRGLSDGRETDVVRLAGRSLEPRRYHLDAESHRLVGIEEAAPPGVGRISRRLFSDFKTVDGVVWPMSEERQIDGVRMTLLTLRSVGLDRGVSDSLFARPARLKPSLLELMK